MAMNPEIKARWVAWLRANVDKQGRGYLQQLDTSDYSPAGFCCLGGLCELAVQDGIIQSRSIGDGQAYCVRHIAYGGMDGSDQFLPESVRLWAGLDQVDPRVSWGDPGNVEPLTYLNDQVRLDFNQIADLIEAQL